MSQSKQGKGKRSRSTEARLFLTAASIAATVAGVSLFATNDAALLAQSQNQEVAVASQSNNTLTVPAPGTLQDESSGSDTETEEAPAAQATATPVPAAPAAPSARGRRSQFQPGAMGTTRSSR